jgi:hypothetical protein
LGQYHYDVTPVDAARGLPLAGQRPEDESGGALHVQMRERHRLTAIDGSSNRL